MGLNQPSPFIEVILIKGANLMGNRYHLKTMDPYLISGFIAVECLDLLSSC